MSMPEQLSVLNEEYKILPGSQSLHKLIKWDRDSCALDFLLNESGEHRAYSYRELRNCVLSIQSALHAICEAQQIKKQGSQCIIPVLLPQSPALYIAILAILEAGAAFCPINLDSPLDRVRFVVGDVSAEVVVTNREYEHLFKWDGGPNILLVDETSLTPDGNKGSKSNSCTSTPPHDIAYVMYTSGSTGNPKGVAVSHLAVSQTLLAHDKHIPPFNRFLQFASPSFDVSVFEIFFPLFRGATLVGSTRRQMLNDLVGVINNLDIDALELTPTVVGSLIQNRSKVPGLRLLLTIGEMLTRPVVDLFGNSDNADGILYAMYGPTETTIHCTINSRMEIGSPVGDIGIPLDTVSAFVIASKEASDAVAEVSLLPIGQVGELVIGGPQLADEYLNRKEQNESTFISIRGQRAYRTGDRARITSRGRIEILGRISSGQVKIRGQRVELGEIEDAIYRHPHVKIVSVSVLRSALIAFILAKDMKLTTQDLLKACSSWLPSFMIPNEFVVLDAFPYLPSGKIDRKKLEADFESRRTDESNAKAQWNSPTEILVGNIIQDILGFTVSAHARLATYGLDSLAAIRVASLLRSAGFHISPAEILKADDMKSLAHMCENSKYNKRRKATSIGHFEREFDHVWIEQVSKVEGIKHGDIDYIMPCTPVQDAMLSETSIDAVAYNNKIVLEISPQFSTDQLTGALQVLLQSISILRSSFIESATENSAYLQVILKNLPSSQLDILKDSISDTLEPRKTSIFHPLHIQIQHFDNRRLILLHIHHALYDAWSIELILDDLETILHGNHLQKRPQFDNVVMDHFNADEVESTWSSKVYWKDYLSLFNAAPLPNFNSVRNEEQGLGVSTFKTSIATRDLVSTARTLGVSSQSLFQAAYALVLSSYLGTKDVCFGTVFSGRTSSITGIESVIGPCLATLPIRVDLTTASTMADLTKALNLANRKHLDHGSLSLREIKKACGVDPGQPLFDSLFVWQQTLHAYDHRRDYVKVIDSSDYLEFNLTLEISPTAGNISVKANYRRSIFPLRQVDILLRQLDQLVTALISTPETSLPLSDNIFSNEVLSIENINPAVTLFPGSLTSSVEFMATEFPKKYAIEFANSISKNHLDITQVSYADLNFQANQIAHYLISHKVQPNDLVCVCMEKSPQLYISILAICKTGAGYVPLIPDTPPERFRNVISDANIRLVLTDSSVIANLGALRSVQFVILDRLDFSVLPSKNPLTKFEPDNLAYCVFTSGSTGKPKGVLVTQGNLLSNLQVLAELYPHSHQSKFLQSCSQAFDVSVFEIFFAWHVGSCLCSAANDILFQDIELAIRAMDITHLSLTPTVAALISPANVPKVEFLVTAGEAVTQTVFNMWANRGLYQGYGPSETTNICSVRPDVTKDHSINNIGPPLKNTSVFVLSSAQNFTLAPTGGEGEFCFGGAQVGRGYLDPNQGVGKFIEHPKYGRLYRSGDNGRLLSDGSLSFTGRKDDQVKLRGQRIELGEINSVLLESPEVKDCTSLIIEKSTGTEQHIVCFWTPAGSISRDFAGLKPISPMIEVLFKSLTQALPTYMVPSMLIPVSCLPSTVQGKVDRRRLKSYYRSLDLTYLSQVCNTTKVDPDHVWTDLEVQIARRISEIAKVSFNDVTPDTSFFGLGIDSLSAISLSRVLREKDKTLVDISDILKYPSVSRLASRISQRFLPKTETALSSLVAFDFDPKFLRDTIKSFENAGRSVERILPCTPLQEAMLSAAETSIDAYKNRLVLKINVNMVEFQRIWIEMIKRHEILRTCFVRTSNPRYAYAQVVLSNFVPVWEMSDRVEAAAVRRDTGAKISCTEFNPPYNLQFRKSHKALKLELSLHHAIYDGFAMSILLEEIEKALQNIKLTAPVSPVPFLQYISSLDFVEADEYWIKLLAEFSPSQFPHHIEKSHNLELGQTSTLKISSESQFSWVETQIKAYGTSMLSVIQTIWASTLSGLFDTTDVCFGNVVSGRTVPVENVENLVAPCFNTIPVRIKNMERLNYLEAFRVLQIQNAESLQFQLTPLRRIQARQDREDGRIFETLLILQKPSNPLNPSIWSVVEDSGKMDLPLVLEVIPETESDTIQLILHTHCSHVSEKLANKLLQTFDIKLKMALENPRRPMISGSGVGSLNRSRRMADKNIDTAIAAVEKRRSNDELNITETAIRDVLLLFTDFPKESIKRNTTIFRLGIDSISSVQVAAELRKQGYQIIGSDVLQHPSIAKLARHLEKRRNPLEAESEAYDFKGFDEKYRQSICSRLNRLTNSIAAVRPCTLVQCGMLAQSLHCNGGEYINSFCLQLVPGTSLSKIRRAWENCVRRNEMLRTGFVEIDDPKSPFAMVTYRAETFSLPWNEDAKSLSNDSSNLDYQKILDALSTCPWNLEVIKEGSVTLLKFTAHHALYDAQSLELILNDIAKNYVEDRNLIETDYLSVSPILSAILTKQSRDEVSRQKFWQEENKICINRFPDLTPLRQSTTNVGVEKKISALSIAQLEGLSRHHEITVQAAGQAAWARLLSCYIGESSVTFGLTLSGRAISQDSEKYAFPTIVTLPVCCDVDGTNAELLQRIMRSNTQLQKHQFTPLTSIQKWVGHPEGKLFDTLFAYQKIGGKRETVEHPWTVVREEASAEYTISMELQPTEDGGVQLRLTFKDTLIPAEQARLILNQYEALLLDTLQNANRSSIAVLDLGHDLLSITPASQPTLPSPVKLLHEFVESQIKLIPRKTAFEFTTGQDMGNLHTNAWSFAQLDTEGNKIANLLMNHGAKNGDLIAICFNKCPEASFAILGILKAGCAYVALDPSAPPDRLKFIAEDSGSNLILSIGEVAQSLSEVFEESLTQRCGIEVLDLGNIRTLENLRIGKPKLARPIEPQDICYCLYTSGTTGTPKGCEITHENAVQAMLSFQKLFEGHWTEESKWLQFASFHFDVSVLEQFWSWSIGICVASAPRDLIFEDISGMIRKLGITHIDLTPSLARLIHPNDVPSLTKGVFITGGEQLRQEILDAWGDYKCIYNGYGPTEVTIGCTMYPRVPKNGKPSNIGPQFQNVGSYVLKLGTTQPVLRGAIGELCVSGKLLGRGYLNRPELTKECFPYLEDFGERVYRTGDLVRILHDGSFLFLGRADDQIKLRGQRLELSEINEVIKTGAGNIQDVVTLVLKHDKQQKEQLVTFFVPAPTRSIANANTELASSLRAVCKSRLPGYMVPTFFIPLGKLPLSSNNKADFKELEKLFNRMSISDLHNFESSSRMTQNWTAKEKSVMEILATCMNVEYVTIANSSNIFELGIDSISIISLVRRLQMAGFKNASLAIVMKNTSIDSLIKNLASDEKEITSNTTTGFVEACQRIAAFTHKHKLTIADELGIDASDIDCLAQCTPIQEGMVYKYLGSDSALYFTAFNYVLDELVDEDELYAAWKRAALHLQILRTKFVLTNDGCAQVVLKNATLPWNLLYMETTEEKTTLQKIDEEQFEVSKEGKTAALANPYSICITHNEKKRVMSLKIFHGLYDGISLQLLLQKVWEEYQNKPDIDYGPVFHHVIPYGPLAHPANAEDFWRNALKDHTYHALPCLRISPALPESNDTTVTIKIPATEIQHLLTLRNSLGITYQTILLTVWSSVLAGILNPTSASSFALTQGIILSGRSFSLPSNTESGSLDPQDTIGPLLNTVPFHVNITEGMSWKELLQKLHIMGIQIVTEGLIHTPLRDVLRWCGSGKQRELFDTLFVFQYERKPLQEILWRELPGEAVADYPLAFEAQLNNNGDLVLTLVGQAEFLDNAGATNVLAQIEKTIYKLRYPDQPVTGMKLQGRSQAHRQANSEPRIQASQQSTAGFVWTSEALALKAEIQFLSGLSDINEHNSVFSLGLDSIDIIKLVSRLQKRSIHLSVSSILKCQSIASMTNELSNNKSRIKKPATTMKEHQRKLLNSLRKSGKLPKNVTEVLPATPLQEGLVAEMISSRCMRYFNHNVFRVSNDVSIQKLMEVWDTVLMNNGIFRTRFIEIDDVDLPMSFAQVLCYPIESFWYRVELSTGMDLQHEIAKAIKGAIAMAREGKLLQLQSIQHRENEYFVLSIAHALYDGWSLQSLHHDISAAYHGNLVDRPDPKLILELMLNTESSEAERFWKTSLHGLQKSTFPERTCHRGPVTGAVHRRERISCHPLDRILGFCKSISITLQTLGQSTWAIVLATYLKQLDVVFGVVLSCRDTEEANELMFPLMNTVAVRSVIHGSISELLIYMQEMANSIRRFQHFPLRKAQALAGISDGSLFDTLFIYQGRTNQAIPEENKLYESVENVAEVEFAVCVEMEIINDQLIWRTAVKNSVLTDTETDILLDRLDEVIGTVIENPKISTISSNQDGISVCGLQRFEQESSAAIGDVTMHISDHIETSWTFTEIKIRAALSQVAKISEKDINRYQTIFHLGIDSISAIKVSSILRKDGIMLSVNDIVKQSSIINMAKFIQIGDKRVPEKRYDVDKIIGDSIEQIKEEEIIRQVNMKPENVQEILPVTAGQLYMLARWQASAGTLFVGTFEYRVVGSLNASRLQAAWKALLAKHSILRTIFLLLDRKMPRAIQIILNDMENDVRWPSASTPVNHISLLSPVSLSVKKRRDGDILCLKIHHALYDGVSLPLLTRDLRAFYVQTPAYHSLDSSFRRFVALSCNGDDEIVQHQMRFWKSYLNQSTLLNLKDIVDTDESSRIEVFEPGNRIENIPVLAQKNGVSVDAVLLAALAKVYRNILDASKRNKIQVTEDIKDKEDVVFGLYLANRAVYDEDLSSLVAPTLNLLPICISPLGSLAQIAQRIQSDLRKLSSVEVAGSSLAHIYEWTGVRVDCFINILKPFDNDVNDQEFSATFLENSEDGSRQRRAEIIELQSDAILDAAIIERSPPVLHEAYLPSTDIEMRVTDKGSSIDIEVFSPKDNMALEDAMELVEKLVSQLRQFV